MLLTVAVERTMARLQRMWDWLSLGWLRHGFSLKNLTLCRPGFARKRKPCVGSTIRHLLLCVRMQRQRGFRRKLVAAWRQSVKVSQQTTPVQHA